MFYIYANGKSIYQPMDNSLALFSPKLTLEMGKAGSLTFQIPYSNRFYNSLPQMTTTITVEMDDTEIFRGRVLTNNPTFNKVRTVYCEGDLAFLVDSVQKNEKYVGKAHALFRKIIAAHNARVNPEKQFAVGSITIEDRDVLLAGKSSDIQDAETGKFDYKQIVINANADEWPTTFDYIETTLIKYIGGYLRTRRQNGVTYIDLVSDYGSTATQEIEFGKNLLDLTEETSPEDVFTVLIPLGDENLTIETVNNGSDELVDAAAVERYGGRIVKTHVFNGVTKPATLLENGRRYLENHVNAPVTITVKAVDMHLVDPYTTPIYVGDRVHVNSVPHDKLEYLTCTRIDYDLENPANNTYTFGNPRQSLTERYRKDKQSKGGGGGGAGKAADTAAETTEGEIREVFDAWISPNPEGGTLSLGALHELYKQDKLTLSQKVGIDFDAPNGNINIRNLREQVDDNTQKIIKQAARIELINDDTHAQIDLVASRVQMIGDLEAGHYASLSVRADDNESAIAAKADKVTVEAIQGELTATKSELTDTKDVLKNTCGISFDASGRNSNVNISALRETVDSQGNLINSNSANIRTLSSDLDAQIELEAKHHKDQGDVIASIQLTVDDNKSAIRMKANKTYVDSEILSVSGRIEAAEAEIDALNAKYADIDTLIAKKFVSLQGVSLNFIVGELNAVKVNVSSLGGLKVSGKVVATKEYVDEKTTGFATESWVEGKGYLTSLPDTIRVGTLSATGNMYFEGWTVATRRWCETTKNFATQDWVTEQLKSYAKSNHTHSTVAKHKHKIKFNLANGHTHQVTVNGTTYTTVGVSTNATHVVDTYTNEN